MDKKNLIIVILIILLAIAVIYFGYSKYAAWKQQKDLSLYQQGAVFGYEQAVSQLYTAAANCQQVPVFYQNQTITVVAVECLKR